MTEWRTSTYSKGGMDNCVECRMAGRSAQVRDSQHPRLGQLTLPKQEWAALLHAIRRGEM